MIEAEHHDVVAGPCHRPGEAIDVRRDAADHSRRILPRQHQDAHQPLTVVGGRVTYASVVLLGEHDLHFFGEGTHRRLWQWLGAHPLADGGVQFAVWAPNAKSVRVVGDWDGWVDGDAAGATGPVRRLGRYRPVGGARISLQVRRRVGERQRDAEGRSDGVRNGAARRRPPASWPRRATHAWGDGAWMSARGHGPGHPLRIYEMHLASWRHGVYSYRELAGQVADHVGALGFTHVELMPVAEHPFGGSWGYQVTGYYAPTARFGSPDDFRAFVDELHRRGIGVILDWVPAHFPRDEWSLALFDGTELYEHADPRQGEHPDWGTLVFNYGRHEVRNFLIANALYWLEEFHIDGLAGRRRGQHALPRLLARARTGGCPTGYGGRENLDAIDFLRQLNATVVADVPTAMMIAEESTAWPKVTHPVEHGGLGFTHKWNMGWMHDTLGYFSTDPVHRRWHHRELSFGLLYAFSERFVLPISHDEVVHGKGSLLGKMPGDDWQKFANLRALFAWMWAMPGAPLVFMGAELAPWTEWNDAGGLPWHLLDHAPHRGVRDLLAELNRVADAVEVAVGARPRADRVPVARRRRRTALGVRVPALGSRRCRGRGVRRQLHAGAPAGAPGRSAVAGRVACAGRQRQRRSSVDPGYRGGVGTVSATTEFTWQGQPASAEFDLPPLGVVWLGARSPVIVTAADDRSRPWRDPRMRPVITASVTLGLAVGVFGVSFGVGAVSAGATVAAGLRDLAAGVHRSDAVLGGQRDRAQEARRLGARRRAAAGSAQRCVRADDVASADRARSAGDWSRRS